jgi:hypothetical protein
MGYYNFHNLNDGSLDDAHIISNFINYSLYKGLKQKH